MKKKNYNCRFLHRVIKCYTVDSILSHEVRKEKGEKLSKENKDRLGKYCFYVQLGIPNILLVP